MRRKKGRMRTVRRIEAAVFFAAAFGFLVYGIHRYRKEHEIETQISRQGDAVLEEELFFDRDTVFYEGKSYRRNTYVKAILCMGVDRKGDMAETKTTGFGGQADGIVLAAHDTAHETMKLLMIPRDTMTPIILTDLSGNILGKDVQHLALAYAYGDGREKSCEYMAEAVSDLFLGFPIDFYIAADIDVISVLNDLVGGVTVTIPTEGMEAADPSFVYGETVTLEGKQAEKFVRFRDTNREHSALYRMDQQQEYMERFIQAVKEKSRTDDEIIGKLFDGAMENMATNMEKGEYLKAAASGLNTDPGSEKMVYTLPGRGVSTAKYDEFYPDEEGLKQVILSLFFREEK